jgi:hypothetical protein
MNEEMLGNVGDTGMDEAAIVRRRQYILAGLLAKTERHEEFDATDYAIMAADPILRVLAEEEMAVMILGSEAREGIDWDEITK